MPFSHPAPQCYQSARRSVRKRPNRRAPANVWHLQTSRALYGSVSPGKTCPLRRRSAANLNKIFNVSAFSSATVLKPKWIFKAAAKFPRGRTTVYNLISVEKSALFPHDDDDLYCCVPPCSFLSFYFFFPFLFSFHSAHKYLTRPTTNTVRLLLPGAFTARTTCVTYLRTSEDRPLMSRVLGGSLPEKNAGDRATFSRPYLYATRVIGDWFFFFFQFFNTFSC